MLSVWCLVPGNYPTARRLRPLRSLIEDRTIAEKSIDLILSRYLDVWERGLPALNNVQQAGSEGARKRGKSPHVLACSPSRTLAPHSITPLPCD